MYILRNLTYTWQQKLNNIIWTISIAWKEENTVLYYQVTDKALCFILLIYNLHTGKVF